METAEKIRAVYSIYTCKVTRLDAGESETYALAWLGTPLRKGSMQGCAKTRVFHQKPSPVGLTGLNRVLMGFMGQTGENSDSLCRFRIIEANLENQKIILHKMDY